MPPPAQTFWEKVDENQVCYFIWPNEKISEVESLHMLELSTEIVPVIDLREQMELELLPAESENLQADE